MMGRWPQQCSVIWLRHLTCVNHRILLRKLETYGFRGKTRNWFESYLSGRYQKVIFNGKVSKQLEVKSGVPQGSVLGPLLFLIYFNDLASVKIQGKFTFLRMIPRYSGMANTSMNSMRS